MYRDIAPPIEYVSPHLSGNPYEVPAAELQTAKPALETIPRDKLINLAMVWMTGTMISGALFGTLVFPIIGTLVGLVLAGIIGLPTALIVFAVARLIPGPARRRSTVLCLAAMSGGFSGFLAVTLFLGFRPDILVYAQVATCFGILGSVIATQLYLKTASDSMKVRYTPPAWADLDTTQAASGEFRF